MLEQQSLDLTNTNKALATEELEHSNALLAALSQVAARIAATMDPEQVMRTLGSELQALGLSCYIAELDPSDRAMVIRHVSVKPDVLALCERYLGVTPLGIRIPYKRWAHYGIVLRQNSPLFVGNLVTMVSDALAVPRQLVTQAARLAGIAPETPAIHLPLVITERDRGVLVVWGANLGEKDVPALEVFANQVATTLENAQLYERERQQYAQLARANTFIAALSRVAARVASARDLDQVLETLGTELKQLNVTCMVTLLDPDARSLVIEYASIGSDILAMAEKLIGVKMQGLCIAKDRFPIWDELVEQGRAVFVENAVELTAACMPGVLASVIRQAFRLGGWSTKDFVIWLPLLAGDEVKGALGVWGPDLQEADLPTLSVFASQVGITIDNVRLYAVERERTREKEVLLQEIHHRVKNNLQVISSLLHLQSGHVDDKQVQRALTESQERVRSMALVHEKLYRSPDLSRIDFGDYVRDLVDHLLETYYTVTGKVTLVVDVEDIALGIDQAISCGLILNELVSNALQHAFPGGRGGEVCVAMHPDSRRLRLVVSDNGIGLPEDIDIKQAKSLGLQLVSALVQQLEATLRIERRNGTTFSILLRVP
jgi:two-component sensor histidine kinase